MACEIVFTDTARGHYRELDARLRSTVKSEIEKHLRRQPERVSKSRIKRLREIEHPQYRLRVAQQRVFYDVEGEDVVVLATIPKHAAEEWLQRHGVKSS